MSQLKQGFVDEIGENGQIRVRFPDKGNLRSYWLSVVFPFVTPDQCYVMPSVGEPVACMMDETFEQGWIIGQYYTQKTQPPTNNPKLIVMSFANGDRMEYNRETGILEVFVHNCKITAQQKIEVIATESIELTGSTSIALNTPILQLNVAQITGGGGSFGSPGVQMQIQSLDLDAASFIKFESGTPLTIQSKQACVIGGVDSDGDTFVTSGQ